MKRLIMGDAHLGNPAFNKIKFLEKILVKEPWDEIIVNGDLYELLGFKTFSEIINEVPYILSYFSMSNVVKLNGNHDNVWKKNEYEFSLSNGKSVIVTHGHQFDIPKYNASLGVKLNILFYYIFRFEIRRLFNFFKSYQYMEEQAKLKYFDYDYIILSHSHKPKQKENYFNTGSILESFSYIQIIDDKIELIKEDGV